MRERATEVLLFSIKQEYPVRFRNDSYVAETIREDLEHRRGEAIDRLVRIMTGKLPMLHEIEDALDALVFIHLADRLEYPALVPLLRARFPRPEDLEKAARREARMSKKLGKKGTSK
jgi:hypothetical protein